MEIKKILQYKLANKEVQALEIAADIFDRFCQNQFDEGCKGCVLECCCSQLTDKDESCARFVYQMVDQLIEHQEE